MEKAPRRRRGGAARRPWFLPGENILPAVAILLAMGLLPSCKSTPYGLGRRLQGLRSSLSEMGGFMGGELRRARTLPAETASLFQTVPFTDLQKGAAFTGSFLQEDFRRVRGGASFLGKAFQGEMEKAGRFEHPSPIVWDYLGSEPARAAAALSGALWLWNMEWTDRLGRGPWRSGETAGARGEIPFLPRPLTMGQALLLSLPIW